MQNSLKSEEKNMQEDFHYYATYCAAYLAGFTHEESLDICYSAQLVDLCSRTFLSKIKAPLSAATTQLQLELMEVRTDTVGLQDIVCQRFVFHTPLCAGKDAPIRQILPDRKNLLFGRCRRGRDICIRPKDRGQESSGYMKCRRQY